MHRPIVFLRPLGLRLTNFVGTFINRNRAYSVEEEELLKSALKLSEQTGMNSSDIAKHLSPILGRTKKGVELKLGFLKQELDNGKENKMEIKRVSPEPPAKEIQRTKSPTQIIHEHVPGIDLFPFTLDDVGRRVKVKVYNMKPYGAFCCSEDGKSGLLLVGMVSTNFVDDIGKYLQIGDEFYVLVIQDQRDPSKVLLNAKVIGNIIPIDER